MLHLFLLESENNEETLILFPCRCYAHPIRNVRSSNLMKKFALSGSVCKWHSVFSSEFNNTSMHSNIRDNLQERPELIGAN